MRKTPVLMSYISVPLDVGAPAIDRGNNMGNALTVIERSNPCNADGVITKVKVFTVGAGSIAWRVGTFYLVSGATYMCRDAQDVGILVEEGYHELDVELDIVEGDFIGCYIPAGHNIELDESGPGIAYWEGNACYATQDEIYNELGSRMVSLYGEG